MARIFSAIQPSGKITLGHYLGTIINWQKLQKRHDCVFCVADLHAITVPQTPENLSKNTWETLALFIACGLDQNNILFVQSHVNAHAQLAWIIQSMAPLGYLLRMTQFKDKSEQHKQNAGLLTYPALMAADILLYDTEMVPVGEDQKQHLEFTRDMAERFNKDHENLFIIPEPIIAETCARVMSLQDPNKKMSKSDPNQNSWIAITDTPDKITKKIKRAVTDSDGVVAYDLNRPGISNLVSMFACLAHKSHDDIASQYQGLGYGVFKNDLANLIIEEFAPIQDRYHKLIAEPEQVNNIIYDGSVRANKIANNVLERVLNKFGFL